MPKKTRLQDTKKVRAVAPNYYYFRSFGSTYFVLQSHEHNKLEPRSRFCCLLGYDETQNGYRCYDPISHHLHIF